MTGDGGCAARLTAAPEPHSVRSRLAQRHDALSPAALGGLAEGCVEKMFALFPYALPPAGSTVVEIGARSGRVMAAMADRLSRHNVPPRQLIGLEAAEPRPAGTRQRTKGWGRHRAFLPYDGLTLPLDDRSVDLLYSAVDVPLLPKLYAYRLFFEARRVLKPGGFAVFFLMSFKGAPDGRAPEIWWPWRVPERERWLLSYAREELETILTVGTKFNHVHCVDGGCLWLCASPQALTLPHDFSLEGYRRNNPALAPELATAESWLADGFKEHRTWRPPAPNRTWLRRLLRPLG